MSIHDYIWLYLENEEEIEVEETRTSSPPPREEHQAGNYFYFDICGIEPGFDYLPLIPCFTKKFSYA
jgi:hypothetical protein